MKKQKDAGMHTDLGKAPSGKFNMFIWLHQNSSFGELTSTFSFRYGSINSSVQLYSTDGISS